MVYCIECIVCEERAEEDYEFKGAIENAKSEGYKTKKDSDGNWVSYCPNCLDEFYND